DRQAHLLDARRHAGVPARLAWHHAESELPLLFGERPAPPGCERSAKPQHSEQAQPSGAQPARETYHEVTPTLEARRRTTARSGKDSAGAAEVPPRSLRFPLSDQPGCGAVALRLARSAIQALCSGHGGACGATHAPSTPAAQVPRAIIELMSQVVAA